MDVWIQIQPSFMLHGLRIEKQQVYVLRNIVSVPLLHKLLCYVYLWLQVVCIYMFEAQGQPHETIQLTVFDFL